MPKVEVKLFIEESDLARAEKALCEWAGVPITGPNSKKALVEFVKQLVLQEEHKLAAVTPPVVE